MHLVGLSTPSDAQADGGMMEHSMACPGVEVAHVLLFTCVCDVFNYVIFDFRHQPVKLPP